MKTFSNTKDWITKSRVKHGNTYDYSKSVYSAAKNDITITCKIHGDFSQQAYLHSVGYGCQTCGIEKSRRPRLSTAEFISKAQLIHGDLYDYSEVRCNGARKKVDISCGIHGTWSVVAYSHLAGTGCPKCRASNIGLKHVSNISNFLDRAKVVHGDEYDYSLVEYKNARSKVKIICKLHGLFEQVPDWHLNRSGKCPRCTTILHAENEWLTKKGIPNDAEHRQVKIKLYNGSIIIADGYDEVNNTVYEFWGSYFHGHPSIFNSEDKTYYGKTFGELYEGTQKKIENIKKSGYVLVDVWEHEIFPNRFKQSNLTVEKSHDYLN